MKKVITEVQLQKLNKKLSDMEMKQIGAFKMLPPKPDVCQMCATKHDPTQPHNQQSLYYQYAFYADHERWPTWADAMEHCSEQTKDHWIEELKKRGVWKES